MDLSGIVSSSREKISEARQNIASAIDGDKHDMIEEKEKFEEKIDQLSISQREWKKFSNLLEQEKPVKAEKVARGKFEWDKETVKEAARLYASAAYLDGEINLSESQESVYNAGKIMKELEEYLDTTGRKESSKIIEEFREATKSLNKAGEKVLDAEKDLDRSLTTSEHFSVTNDILDRVEEKEEVLDRTRREIKSVESHMKEMKERITK